jgi:hypothetical protein
MRQARSALLSLLLWLSSLPVIRAFLRPYFTQRLGPSVAMEATAHPNDDPTAHLRPSTIEKICIPQTYDSVKVYVISDLHVDYRQNLDW